MWEVQIKEMVSHNSKTKLQNLIVKVPFHKTSERKKGLGKLRERLERKNQNAQISSLTFYEL
jgi:hypothetical protein